MTDFLLGKNNLWFGYLFIKIILLYTLYTQMKYISHSIVFLFLTIIHYSYSWCQNVKLIEKSQVLCVDYSTDGTLIVITTNQSVTIW